ncbi:MAG: hypothetical protein JWL73_356 [Actinomycetia bacterium]|nr:hypothetical protein [Actinomycetes bacterium]
MTIAKGQPWGEPWDRPPDVEVWGADRDVAIHVRDNPGATIRFHPDSGSDLARAVGLRSDTGGDRGETVTTDPGSQHAQPTRVPVDALEMADGNLAVNAVVVGTPPDRLAWRSRTAPVEVVVDGRTVFSGKATTVLIANGEFVNGADAVPRGHPGDGRLEIQVYALDRGGRRGMRVRLGRGTHVPHPDITQASGRHVEVHVSESLPLVSDGAVRGEVSKLDVTVRPTAFYLLV